MRYSTYNAIPHNPKSKKHPYESLENHDFTAQKPNEKFLTDITVVPCQDGKLYLAAVLDCFDGSIQGSYMDNNMRTELCVQALENACRNTNRQSMFHKGRFLTQWPKTFLAVLKCERVPLQHYDFPCTAYSNVRPHSALGWLSPSAFE